MAPFAMKVIRGAFGIGERISPRMSGEAAFWLFSRTPNPKRLSERERQAVARAAPLMATARHHRLRSEGGCFMLHEFRPEGRRWTGTVLVLHGWQSRTEYMARLIEGLRDAGLRVMAMDFPGHGQSTGRKLNMAIAVRAVAHSAQWFGPFDAIVAHSFGGAVAVNSLAGTIGGVAPVKASKLVLIAAPESIENVLGGFGKLVNLGRRSSAAMQGRIKKISGRTLEQFGGKLLLAPLGTPTLIIHAPDDREVSERDARTYAEAGSHVVLHWADGLGHRRILGDSQVVARAVEFVTAADETGRGTATAA